MIKHSNKIGGKKLLLLEFSTGIVFQVKERMRNYKETTKHFLHLRFWENNSRGVIKIVKAKGSESLLYY